MNTSTLAREIAAGTEFLAKLPGVKAFRLIGSAMYLPAAQVNDVDFAVMLEDGRLCMNFTAEPPFKGWKLCGDDYDIDGGTWCAIRKGDFNLMVTHSQAFYDGYIKAMEVCKALNLVNKTDRIKVCRIVRDGKTADEVAAFGTEDEL